LLSRLSDIEENNDEQQKRALFASLFQQFSHEIRIIRNTSNTNDARASLSLDSRKTQKKVANPEKEEKINFMNACVALAREHFILIKC